MTKPPEYHRAYRDPPVPCACGRLVGIGWQLRDGSGAKAMGPVICDRCWGENLKVSDVADNDCVLLMWATFPCLPDALKVIEAWGFTYKTVAYTWIKTTRGGLPKMGCGYWTRANAEICLLATRGKPKRLSKSVRQVIQCPLGRHSRKPYVVYENTERLLAGDYLEMFARPDGPLFPFDRSGWTQIGNEITGRDIQEDLELLATDRFTPQVAEGMAA